MTTITSLEIQALGAAIMADAPDSVLESCELDYLINNAEHDLKSCIGHPQETKKRAELNELYARRHPAKSPSAGQPTIYTPVTLENTDASGNPYNL